MALNIKLSVFSDEVVGHLFAGEALVCILEWVGEELRVLLKMVRFVVQEVVQFSQPACVHCFAIRLGTVVRMAVFVRQVFISVRHVLGRVDFVVLSFAVLNFVGISGSVHLVLAQVSTNYRAVGLGVISVKESLKTIGNCEETGDSPSNCHWFEVSMASNDFEASKESSKQGEAAGSVVSVVKSGEILAIFDAHIVAEQVAHAHTVTVSVVPFKAIVFGDQFFEPRPA